MSFSIRLVDNKLDRYADRFPRAVQDGVTLAANNTLRRSRPLTPFRTGHLRNTAQVEIGRLVARVFWMAAYAAYQEYGTRGATAPPGSFLVFEVGGRMVFARSVRGVKARRFARDPAEAEGRALIAFLTAVAGKM